VIARFHVEEGKIPDNGPVTVLYHNMVAPIAMVMLPKLDYVTKTTVQLMEDGVIGVSGVNAWFHAEAGKKPENVFVTTLNQNMMAKIALAMLRKQHRVTKTLVQNVP